MCTGVKDFQRNTGKLGTWAASGRKARVWRMREIYFHSKSFFTGCRFFRELLFQLKPYKGKRKLEPTQLKAIEGPIPSLRLDNFSVSCACKRGQDGDSDEAVLESLVVDLHFGFWWSCFSQQRWGCQPFQFNKAYVPIVLTSPHRPGRQGEAAQPSTTLSDAVTGKQRLHCQVGTLAPLSEDTTWKHVR